MKRLIVGALMLASFGASAECWIVEGMHGVNYSSRNNYAPEDDGFSGTFTIETTGDNASLQYSGADAGGVVYKAMSSNSIIGFSANGDNQRVVDSWVIQPDGAVLMSKTITGYGDMDSTKAFVGKVKSKC